MARLTRDNSQVKQRADMLQHQLEYVQDRNEERERELESLRYQHVELSTASDQKATIGQLQQQILTMKVVIYIYMYMYMYILCIVFLQVYMYMYILYCIHVWPLLFLLYIHSVYM